MTARCDSCKAEVEPNVRVRREGGIETTFFCCPGCGQEYAICRTNPEIRKLQQKVEQLRARIAKQRRAGTLKPQRLEGFQELARELKVKMGEFNGRNTGA